MQHFCCWQQSNDTSMDTMLGAWLFLRILITVVGPPPGQGGYYPQQPQPSYQQGYPQYGQPGYPQQGYQPNPGPQTVYVEQQHDRGGGSGCMACLAGMCLCCCAEG
ncbi:hypothetical protein H2248_010856 [Termitomyces sp. 'cryptogamus']|nr:hypothetical protein H2248_010856 [Termitomyces sp. 'cryptogamus']KAH0582961.1 hypothetical protein H2248_010856 [Termitomyces sp. 'cryptogamus']